MARTPEALLRRLPARYLAGLRPPIDALRREMLATAEAEGVPVTHPDVARLWEALAAVAPAGRVLELGVGIGYGTLHLARGAHRGQIVGVDADPVRLARAAGFLERAGVASRVELLPGRALDLFDRLSGPFDLMVIDVDAADVRRCLDLALPLLAVGGRLAVDRMLLGGRVADPARRLDPDPEAVAMERFHPYLTIHPQLASVLLPVGDGVGLATKRRETLRELGGPY